MSRYAIIRLGGHLGWVLACGVPAASPRVRPSILASVLCFCRFSHSPLKREMLLASLSGLKDAHWPQPAIQCQGVYEVHLKWPNCLIPFCTGSTFSGGEPVGIKKARRSSGASPDSPTNRLHCQPLPRGHGGWRAPVFNVAKYPSFARARATSCQSQCPSSVLPLLGIFSPLGPDSAMCFQSGSPV